MDRRRDRGGGNLGGAGSELGDGDGEEVEVEEKESQMGFSV